MGRKIRSWIPRDVNMDNIYNVHTNTPEVTVPVLATIMKAILKSKKILAI